MATVYSLICWGGKDGYTVTLSNASPCVMTTTVPTNHGLRDGTGIVLSTTGSLPTGLTAGTTYYTRSTGAKTLNLYDTESHALAGGSTGRVNTSSAGSGTHTAKAHYYTSLASKTRWTYSSTEYIFNGLAAWNTHRTTTVPAGTYDTEICEIGMDFDDWSYDASGFTITVASQTVRIETKVDGVRSDGFHGGDATVGYQFKLDSAYSPYAIIIGGYRRTIDGIRCTVTNTGSGIKLNGRARSINNIVTGTTSSGSYGIACASSGTEALFNLVKGFVYGINTAYAINGHVIANNFITSCTTGMAAEVSGISGFMYNNISVGNTTNWATLTSGPEGADKNAGLSGEAWKTGSGTRITIATTDFVNYAGGDYRPATSSSPQVDTGVNYYELLGYDIAGDEVPNYNNGGAESPDVGCYEFDHGYGNHPVTRDLDLSGIVAGSQVVVYDTGTTTVLDRDDNLVGSTYNYPAGQTGVVVDYTIYKLGYDPIRVTGVALELESTAVTVQQVSNRAWIASSGLTYSTDVLYTVGSPNTLKVRIASTLQNVACLLYEAFIAGTTYTALQNIAFPIASFGDTSFTLLNGCETRGWSTAGTAIANTTLDLLSRDGLRYSSDGGTTTTAQWAAILTLDTGAGLQIKYRQSPSGAIVSANNTGPMDELVQVYGNASYGSFDYRGHMVLRAPKPGYSQPMPDLVATYGDLSDNFYVAALAPVLEYTITNASVDSTNMTFNNTTKVTNCATAHTMLELYQEAQYWANLDAQWDADIPLVTTDGSTFTQPSTWTVTGAANLSGGTLAGGSATIGTGTQSIAFTAITLNLGAAGTYTFDTAGSLTVSMTPTAPGTYGLADCAVLGTLDLRNTSGTHAITVELPSGTSYTTASNTGATITVTFPTVTADISITGMPDAVGAYNRLQIINQTALSAAAWQANHLYTDGTMALRSTGVGTENTAGLYMRVTTQGTSGATEPTWNTTPGGTTSDGTVTWTTYKVLYYDADPAGTSLTDSYVDGEEFAAGETAEIRFAEMDAGTSFKTYHTTTIAASTGFSVSVNEESDSVFAANGLNGSSYESTFSPNYTDDYIVLDANTDFSGKAAYAYFCYLLTSSNGMYEFWDGIFALDTGNYRIETDVLNLYFDESAGFVKQTDDVRIFRSDGLRPALDPTTGGSGIEINWRTPVSVVSTGGSALTPTESAYLLALPSASTVASTVLTSAQSAPIHSDIRKVNSYAVDGDGQAGTEWGPA